MGDKCWWWSIEGPLVVNIVLLRQRERTKDVLALVVPVGSKDQIILERSTGQNQAAGGYEGGPIVGLSIEGILKCQSWALRVDTAGTDKAGERKRVERVVLLGLEEGQSAVDIRTGRVGSDGAQ